MVWQMEPMCGSRMLQERLFTTPLLLGGRAVWNVQNAVGSKVATGVYLIFCSSPQTKETKIIKLLVIH